MDDTIKVTFELEPETAAAFEQIRKREKRSRASLAQVIIDRAVRQTLTSMDGVEQPEVPISALNVEGGAR